LIDKAIDIGRFQICAHLFPIVPVPDRPCSRSPLFPIANVTEAQTMMRLSNTRPHAQRVSIVAAPLEEDARDPSQVGRPASKQPGEFLGSQNWIGGARSDNAATTAEPARRR
jgi:hypothetical protein